MTIVVAMELVRIKKKENSKGMVFDTFILGCKIGGQVELFSTSLVACTTSFILIIGIMVKVKIEKRLEAYVEWRGWLFS